MTTKPSSQDVFSHSRALSMSMSLFLVLLLLKSLVNCDQYNNEQTFVVEAISGVLVEYFAKNYQNKKFITVGDRGGFASTITELLIQKIPGRITVQVATNNNNNNMRDLKSPTIILLDSLQHLDELMNWLPHFDDSRGTWHKHLLYVEGLTTDDIITRYQTDPAISEVGFLVNYDGLSIELASAFWFSPHKCHENQIKTINKFTRHNGRWENSNFYPNKYRNFHGCPIQVSYSVKILTTNLLTTSIFKALADTLNFKLVRKQMSVNEFSFLDKQTNMIEFFSYQNEGAYGGKFGGSITSAVVFDDLTFAVPPGEPLTDLEKMFAAFDKETWIAIGATFAIALVVILIISFMTIKVQENKFTYLAFRGRYIAAVKRTIKRALPSTQLLDSVLHDNAFFSTLH
jgi:hypothetical protein